MRGMLEMTMGSRNTVPLRMLRIVPLGDFHIFFSLNSAVGKTNKRTNKQNASTTLDGKKQQKSFFLSFVFVQPRIRTVDDPVDSKRDDHEKKRHICILAADSAAR